MQSKSAQIGEVDVVARDARYVADAIKIRYTPFVLSGGHDSRLIDQDGRELLDFSSLWSLAGLGYSNRVVRDAIVAELDRTQCSILASAINEQAGELAERLASRFAEPKKVWFGLSGSDASEAAQRLILRATGKRRIVSFIGSWHGTTDATMALSGHTAFTASFGGSNLVKIPFPDPYRPPFPPHPKIGLVDQCLGYLENVLFPTIVPPDDVAAIFVEGIQADSGDIVPPVDFLPKLRALCDRYGILLVIDEVKVGLGRTGRFYSFEHAGIEPDMVILGKALGGGLPMSALIGPPEIMDVGTGLALYTISGYRAGAAAALATLDQIDALGLVDHAAEVGAYLLERLQTLRKHAVVGDVRGMGLICGVDLVTDRISKHPNQPVAAKVVYRCWQLGLILFYAGAWGNALEITPPLILTRAEVDEGVAILDQAITDVLAGKVRDEDIAAYAGW
ncbi:MAG TPA: aspartate aminotransferase family protein [Thermomicrobiales bacterium]|nr:aspartate aminotransferase family protein [Thermomicrobiales bacterium]